MNVTAIAVTAIICATLIITGIVNAVSKTKEPRLKRTECRCDENGNIKEWAYEYE